MARRRRHYIGPDGGPLCRCRHYGAMRLVGDWCQVDCEDCHVRKFLQERRESHRLSSLINHLFPEVRTMKLPDTVKAIRDRYVAKFPVPQCAFCAPENLEAFEARVREWTVELCEQVAYDLPNEGWGTKRADAGRPISKDTITRRTPSPIDPDGAVLTTWDLLSGTSTGKPTLVPDPDSIDTTGQVFVEVTPTNHVADLPMPQPPPDEDKLTLIFQQLDRIATVAERLETQLREHDDRQEIRDVEILKRVTLLGQQLDTLTLKGTIKVPFLGTATVELTNAAPKAYSSMSDVLYALVPSARPDAKRRP